MWTARLWEPGRADWEGRETEREKQRQRDKEIDTQRETHTETQRDREALVPEKGWERW